MSQGTPNPYQSPTEQSLGMGGAQPSARTAQMLMETRPWVKFVGIMMFIGISFMIIGAIGLIVTGISGEPGQGFPFQFVLMGGLYGVFAILYFFPARFLMRYASHIEAFVRDGTTEQLDNALEAQKSFWKFAGIFAAIMVAIYAVIFVVMIIVGGISAVG